MQVEAALADGRTEFQSITDTKSELLQLQAEVQRAHERLHVTQARVDQNVKRLTELKAEAANITRLNNLSAQELTEAAQHSTHPEVAELRDRRISGDEADAGASLAAQFAEVSSAGAGAQATPATAVAAQPPRTMRAADSSRPNGMQSNGPIAGGGSLAAATGALGYRGDGGAQRPQPHAMSSSASPAPAPATAGASSASVADSKRAEKGLMPRCHCGCGGSEGTDAGQLGLRLTPEIFH